MVCMLLIILHITPGANCNGSLFKSAKISTLWMLRASRQKRQNKGFFFFFQTHRAGMRVILYSNGTLSLQGPIYELLLRGLAQKNRPLDGEREGNLPLV